MGRVGLNATQLNPQGARKGAATFTGAKSAAGRNRMGGEGGWREWRTRKHTHTAKLPRSTQVYGRPPFAFAMRARGGWSGGRRTEWKYNTEEAEAQTSI